jgi:solute carrier family 35 (UDP-xylose/UDP-N-acetylglucosamine transporter), member B4
MDDVRNGYTNLLSLPSPEKVSATELGISPIMYLVINLLSQLVCVAGVNRLSSVSQLFTSTNFQNTMFSIYILQRVSSVSTNLVLTTRKALSLCISVWYFGNGVDMQLATGAGMVFLGSLVFGRVSAANEKRTERAEASDKKTQTNGVVPQTSTAVNSESISSTTALQNHRNLVQRTARR